MKTIYSLILFAFITASPILAQGQPHSHNDHIGKLLGVYFDIKDALVSDNFQSANRSLSLFEEEVNSSSEMNIHPSHAQQHDAHHDMMKEAVTSATSAENIAQLRGSFDEITNELLKAIENQGYSEGTLYVQFCPMQNDGKGAKWISREENIMNPYFGAQMLKCGSNLDKIE
jgi:Cu(I)/Ag(I) efflux system membrane fusion protein